MYIEKGIFDVMAGCSINERMDGLLLQNEEYIKMQNKIEEQIMLFDKLNLTKVGLFMAKWHISRDFRIVRHCCLKCGFLKQHDHHKLIVF